MAHSASSRRIDPIVTIAAVCAALPLLWPAIPPLTDVPGHIGRYHVMLADGANGLSRWYDFRWRLVPNIGVDAFVRVLAPMVGLFAAVKIVAMAIPPLTFLGAARLSRAAHGRVSAAALLAIPFAYNQAFLMGFVNFALAMAGSLYALGWWLDGRERPSMRRDAIAIGTGTLLWLVHAFGFATFALGIVAFEAQRWAVSGDLRRLPWARAARVALHLVPPLVLLAIWRTSDGGDTTGFFDLPWKGVALLAVLRDRWVTWDAACMLVLAAGVYIGLRERWLTMSGPLGWCAAAWGLAFLLLPRWLAGSAAADMRLAPFAVLMALLALRPIAGKQRAVLIATGTFCVARIAGLVLSLALYGARYDRELAALDHLPRGARVATLVSTGCDSIWMPAKLDHLGGLALARRDAFVNDQWPMAGAPLMHIAPPPGAASFAHDPSQLMPCRPDALAGSLARVPRAAFDYVWVINAETAPPVAAPFLSRVWSDGPSALYRVERR